MSAMSYVPSAHLGDLGAALVDDQLDEPTRRLTQQHLASCWSCRREVEEQRHLKARLRGLSEPGPPAALLMRLHALQAPPAAPADEPLAAPFPGIAADPAPVAGPLRRLTVMRDPRRGRRVLAGAASLLLVGAGTALASSGGVQAAAPIPPATSTLVTRGASIDTSMRLNDPAFAVMSASFAR